jgi:hypothetical protein
MIIAQFPIEIHSERGQFAESPLKTVGNVHSLGDYYAIRSSCVRVQIVAYDETRKVFLVSSPIRIILVVYYRYCCENDLSHRDKSCSKDVPSLPPSVMITMPPAPSNSEGKNLPAIVSACGESDSQPDSQPVSSSFQAVRQHVIWRLASLP